MSLVPGAPAAFKAKPASVGGIKPQQVGDVKFPGKINPKIARLLPNMPITKHAAISNAALGAMFATLFGRVSATLPGLKNSLAGNQTLRDAAIGAAVAIALERHNAGNERDTYTQRPDAPSNGWKLQ